ncbi:MAG: hypothetical protein DWQ47_03610 [Acidobacteria bacterium]|nr:MAG: hypothetical protein DWQ32_07160 [Acidobacteriota bacterium]REK01488.1 MAG: hypothetical protein DWQ38_03595 [Acidobacteriota bacterium]REK14444.1 MAG: hypothetical protein DWQ43_12850 [Acidobacteriota bacterium]REK45159.1 MAG: hypothetical protein DWQ47_03610 [Acidobacteriota bacterium]
MLGVEAGRRIRSSGSNDSTQSELRVLLLSTSLLVDRVLLYSDLVPELSRTGTVDIWASSYEVGASAEYWDELDANVDHFPRIRPFKEFPYNYLRRLNEYVWDFRYRPPSRLSMMKHRRNKRSHFVIRALKPPARILASVRGERLLERSLERLLLSYPRSEEAKARLEAARPDVVVVTGPFQFEQPAVVAAAKELGIPTLAYIPSWDNVSTKNRMVFDYDGYIVWNETIKNELNEFYPRSADRPVYVVGAPQFDLLSGSRFEVSRQRFCEEQDLDPDLPIVVYAIGSPNFLNEPPGAEHLAKRVAEGHLGEIQLLIRPHPIHDNGEMRRMFDNLTPAVRLQTTPNAGKNLTRRTQDEAQIVEWFNTFRHADVVVNMSSTVTIDAALFDTPVVNLDFDPQPGQPDQELIKEINHRWEHFRPIAESGGVWLVNDFQELESAIKSYLEDPALHSEKRRWIAEYVCGYLDGACGKRMADAIAKFVAEEVPGEASGLGR